MYKNTPRILLLCATRKGYEVLRAVLRNHRNVLKGICTFREVDMQEKFYDSIIKLAKSARIPVFSLQDFRKDPGEIIKTNNIDCIFAISWKYYLPPELNKYLKYKIIVIHDSLLPKYRGFAPLATALINGETKVGVTALFAADQIDQGPVILQKKVHIPPRVYINDAIQKITELYCDAVLELVAMLKKQRKITGYRQNELQATYSIWRSPGDCQIDWHKSSGDIYNLIRSVGYPYTGAFTYLRKKKVLVWKAEPLDDEVNFAIRQPGKIWQLDTLGRPTIVCGKGMLKLTEATCMGRSIFPVKKLRQKFYFKDEI